MPDDNKASPQGAKNRSKILVCDDSKMVRATANKYLSSHFDVILAEDGEEGWEKICEDHAIQTVFTDLGMPKLNGYGLIERVRGSEDERIRSLPMIVITGANDDEAIKRRVFDVGATDFIGKPFKATALVARAESHSSYRLLNSQLKGNVDTDALTGVFNHKGIQNRLIKDMSFVTRHSENLAVAIFQVDDFDAIYKRVGKKTSENVLKEVVKILGKTVREEDSIGRTGLAKFTLSLPMAKTEGVIKLCKRVSAKVQTFKIKMADEIIQLTCTVGISSAYRDNYPDLDVLIQSAEQALANAKALGKGEVQFVKLDTNDVLERPAVTSIDSLLEQIEQGDKEAILDKIDSAIHQLAPLIALMSEDQKQQLLT